MRRNKVICTAGTGPFAELLAVSLPTFESYAQRHGWEVFVDSADRTDGRPAAWGKIPLIAEMLRSHDLVMWVDADAVIVDETVDLASELRARKHLYLVEHRHAPTGEVTANAGVLMFRAGGWAKRLLEAIWAQEDLIAHRWWENAALMRLLGYRIDPQPAAHIQRTRWLRRVRFLDVAWNSMPHWHGSPSPRITHYASLPLGERHNRMLTDTEGLRPGGP
jgi:galactosyl transferase GMA12/MNN10 family